jgi:hypothetical protein
MKKKLGSATALPLPRGTLTLTCISAWLSVNMLPRLFHSSRRFQCRSISFETLKLTADTFVSVTQALRVGLKVNGEK